MGAFYKYIVTIYDDRTNTSDSVCGLVYGETYTEAAKQVEDWYGDTIEQLFIEGFAPGPWELTINGNAVSNGGEKY